MKRFLHSLIPGLLLVPALAMTAFAVTVTVAPQFAPRDPVRQQTTYIRMHGKILGSGTIAINGKACKVATTGTCIVKFGAIPAEAFLLRQTLQIITVFNSTTSDVIGIGSEVATGVNTMAATDVTSGAGAISSPAFVANSSGILLSTTVTTGAGKTQTGANGGYDLYASYTWVGASAATTGEFIYVLEYAAPNDGDCIATPMGSLPTAC